VDRSTRSLASIHRDTRSPINAQAIFCVILELCLLHDTGRVKRVFKTLSPEYWILLDVQTKKAHVLLNMGQVSETRVRASVTRRNSRICVQQSQKGATGRL
jgi:hypothetical protein